MVKKFIYVLACAFISTSMFAQDAYDALRYSEQYAEGTARSVAMGNAFVALGGDMGGLSVNPAASAVYRYSEFMFTPTLTVANSESDYLGFQPRQTRQGRGLQTLVMWAHMKQERQMAL